MTGKQKLAKIQDKPATGTLNGRIITSKNMGRVEDGPMQVGHHIGGKFYESFPVLLVRFHPQSPQDLFGKASCTSVSSNVEGKRPLSKHTIDFVPELNSFRIVFHGNPGDSPKIDMVPTHRVSGWTPFEAGETYPVPGSK